MASDMKNSCGDENGDSHNKLELDSEGEKNEVAKRQQMTRKRSIKNSPSVFVDKSSNKSEPPLKKDRLCMGCDKTFGETGDLLLTCEFCGNHRCISCLRMTKLVYKSISGRTDLPWFCNCCIVKSMESVKTTKSIEDRCKEFLVVFQKNVESRCDCLEGSMENVKSSLQKMKDEIVEVKNLEQTGIRGTTLG